MGKSNYSIITDAGKNYSQEEIELILSSFEDLVASTESAKKEIDDVEFPIVMGDCIVAESECKYGKQPWVKTRTRSTIKLDDAIRFLENNGTYEMAVFVSLMFHRILGDRMPERLKRKLDQTVQMLTTKRIVPITIHNHGDLNVSKGDVNINTYNEIKI